MSNVPGTYFFVIDALTPDRLPMARLAEYLADLARLFGHKEHVHFDRVVPGSAVLAQRVEGDYAGQVRDRLEAIGGGGAVPDDAAEAVESLNTRLAKDAATGRLLNHRGAEVINFPGRDVPHSPTPGPIKQWCSLDGVLVRVGGKDDTVPVHLEDGNEIHDCSADRDMARRLAPHLYQGTLRVSGEGRWERQSSGKWKLLQFAISEFKLLDDAPLPDVVDRLQRVEGSGWKQFDDPIAEAMRLRRDSPGD